MFHVRRRPSDGAPRKRKKKPGGPGGVSGPAGQTAGSGLYHHRGSTSGLDHHHLRSSEIEQFPMLIELGADHATESSRTLRIISDVMEVGSANGIALQLYGPHIQPRHCLIQYSADNGVTTLTPLHIDAFTYVNGQRIHQTTVIQVSHNSSTDVKSIKSMLYSIPGLKSLIAIIARNENCQFCYLVRKLIHFLIFCHNSETKTEN